jgi:hypothetical protein
MRPINMAVNQIVCSLCKHVRNVVDHCSRIAVYQIQTIPENEMNEGMKGGMAMKAQAAIWTQVLAYGLKSFLCSHSTLEGVGKALGSCF